MVLRSLGTRRESGNRRYLLALAAPVFPEVKGVRPYGARDIAKADIGRPFTVTAAQVCSQCVITSVKRSACACNEKSFPETGETTGRKSSRGSGTR